MKSEVLSVKEKIGYGVGLLAGRTRSRWGKFRPWVLFGALPFGVVCVLAYSTPPLSLNGKMIYAAITYTLLSPIIAKRYYTLKTPFLLKIMGELAQGARRNQQEFEHVPESKSLQS